MKINDQDLNPSLYTVKAISKEDLEKQQYNFANLVAQLGEADAKEMSQREIVKPESELTSDIINRLKTKNQNTK